MQVIIPCAGKGTRRLPATKYFPKILIYHEGMLIIDRIIESIFAIGDKDLRFVFVVSDKLRDNESGETFGDKIRRHIYTYYPDLHVRFAVQQEPLGFGHAVNQARSLISEGDPVLIHASDTILDFKGFDTSTSWMAVRHAGEPVASGVLQVRDGYVTSIIEKANTFWNAVCYIRETGLMFESLQMLYDGKHLTEGEYQITDALTNLIGSGVNMKAIPFCAVYIEGHTPRPNSQACDKDEGPEPGHTQ